MLLKSQFDACTIYTEELEQTFYNLIKACDAHRRAHLFGTVASGAAPVADPFSCSNWLVTYYFKKLKTKDLCYNQTDVVFPYTTKINLIITHWDLWHHAPQP